MAWIRLNSTIKDETKPLIYRGRRINSGYRFEITNLSSVWVETLSDEHIKERATELESIIALDSQHDITEFFILLEEEMSSPSNLVLNDTLKVELTLNLDETNQQKWYFSCTQLSDKESSEFLGTIIYELFQVISDINADLKAAQANAKELRYHIKNLNRNCAKENPYKPHRFQSSFEDVIQGQRFDQDTYASSGISSDPVSSGNIPSSPPQYPDTLGSEPDKWQDGLFVSTRYLKGAIETNPELNIKNEIGQFSEQDADTTITPAPATTIALSSQAPPETQPDVPGSEAFSQALSQLSQPQSHKETEEELNLKLQRQLAGSKRKRRKF